jgi:hypothetical protein
LVDLSLSDSQLDTSCLLPVSTGLTRLYLGDVTLQPSQAQQDSALGVFQLLQLLARLTALRELGLENIAGEWPQQSAAYSALTASSNLHKLRVLTSMRDAVWVHVFPASRKLPHLCDFLSLTSADSDAEARQSCALSLDTLARLGSCCPDLQCLRFIPLVGEQDDEEAAFVAPLQRLTALTDLHLEFLDPVACARLTALTQLKDLRLTVPPAAGVDDAEGVTSMCAQHLVPLTALTGLTWLATCHEQYDDGWDLDLCDRVSIHVTRTGVCVHAGW